MKYPFVGMPLWLKLTLAGLLVEAIIVGALVASNIRLTEDELINKTKLRVSSAIPLLNAALATPLMQRDYATLNEILTEARQDNSYAYLVLIDRDGHRVASAGLDAATALPALDTNLRVDAPDQVYDTRIALNLSGREYGSLHFGVATGFLTEARARVVRQGIYVGLAAVVLTFFTLSLLGYWLTRRLKQLTRASRALADQDFDSLLPASGGDEVGQLAAAFRQMSHQLRARLSELRDSEQRFFAIANYTYDLELWIEPTGRTIWVNPSVERITGYSQDECLTLPGFPLTLIVEAYREAAAARFQQALRGATGEGYQFEMRRKDGSRFWAAVNWHPIYSREAQFLGIRASIRDISELKLSERKALEYLTGAETERARLNALLSAMKLGILFVGIDGRVIYHNPAFSQIC